MEKILTALVLASKMCIRLPKELQTTVMSVIIVVAEALLSGLPQELLRHCSSHLHGAQDLRHPMRLVEGLLLHTEGADSADRLGLLPTAPGCCSSSGSWGRSSAPGRAALALEQLASAPLLYAIDASCCDVAHNH